MVHPLNAISRHVRRLLRNSFPGDASLRVTTLTVFRGVATAAFFATTAWSYGQAPAAAPLPEGSLRAGEPIPLHLQPRQYTVVHASVDPGRYTEIRIALPDGGIRGTLLRVLPQAPKDAPTPDPVVSESGESFVVLPILPGSAPTVTWQVTPLTNSRAATAPVEAVLSLLTSEPTSEKVLYAHALAAFNKGERLRRAHTGPTEALAASQAAA